MAAMAMVSMVMAMATVHIAAAIMEIQMMTL
jgi:hypothetical protein